MDDVVDSSMTLVVSLTPFEAESVHGSAINLQIIVVTGVGTKKGHLRYLTEWDWLLQGWC